MWVELRPAEELEDAGLHRLGDHVLEALGLLVDLVPAVAEGLGQVHLEQPVVADHLQRHRLPRGRQRGAPVAIVGDQSQLAEPDQHLRCRRGRDTHALGQLGGADGAAQLVEGLDVVLLGLREGRPGADIRHAA